MKVITGTLGLAGICHPEYMSEGKHLLKNYLDCFSGEDRRIIEKFLLECRVKNHKKRTIIHYLGKLKKIRQKFLKKNFDSWDKEDVKRCIVNVNQSGTLGEWAKYGYQVTLKLFFRLTEKPDLVDWIKLRPPVKQDYDIVSRQEVEKMIEIADPRNRAILSVLWAGCRLGELSNMKVDDVKFDESGCLIFISGKTGQRPVRIEFWENLRDYLKFRKEFLRKNKRENEWLWITIDNFSKGHRLSPKAIRISIKKIAKRVGITRRVYCHQFRHSSATELSKFCSDQELRIIFGWTRNSKMPSLYSHLSHKVVDEKLVNIFNHNNHKLRENSEPELIERINQLERTIGKIGNVQAHQIGIKKEAEDIAM